MAETGFGSLSYEPNLEYNDWGFGSPTPTVLPDDEYGSISGGYLTEADYEERVITRERDTGFGSPFDDYNEPIQILGEFALIPDDGGVQIEVLGDWFSLYLRGTGKRRNRGQIQGPFYATFINQDTGQKYKGVGLNRKVGSFSGRGGDSLFVGVPPMVRGDYDLEIKWRETKVIYIADACTVGYRPRCPEAYRIRRNLPAFMKRGPIQSRHEDITDEWKSKGELWHIMQSLGERLQDLTGRPCTGLAERLAYQYAPHTVQVETTVGFPPSGAFYIGDTRFQYTGKTDSSFTGVTADHFFEYKYDMREEVICDVTAIQ